MGIKHTKVAHEEDWKGSGARKEDGQFKKRRPRLEPGEGLRNTQREMENNKPRWEKANGWPIESQDWAVRGGA